MIVNLPCLMESCSNFLRLTCSYTECWPSFPTGACPTERTPASYSSCLYLIILTCLLHTGLIDSVDASPCFIWLALLLMQRFMHSIVISFLFQNPAQSQMTLKLGKGLEFYGLTVACFMLPLPLVRSGALYPSTSLSDHTSLLLSGLCI